MRVCLNLMTSQVYRSIHATYKTTKTSELCLLQMDENPDPKNGCYTHWNSRFGTWTRVTMTQGGSLRGTASARMIPVIIGYYRYGGLECIGLYVCIL